MCPARPNAACTVARSHRLKTFFLRCKPFPYPHLAQQVYVLGCELENIVHLRLDAANGAIVSTQNHTTIYSLVGGADPSGLFRIEALQYVVVAARSASDEVLCPAVERATPCHTSGGWIVVAILQCLQRIFEYHVPANSNDRTCFPVAKPSWEHTRMPRIPIFLN